MSNSLWHVWHVWHVGGARYLTTHIYSIEGERPRVPCTCVMNVRWSGPGGSGEAGDWASRDPTLETKPGLLRKGS